MYVSLGTKSNGDGGFYQLSSSSAGVSRSRFPMCRSRRREMLVIVLNMERIVQNRVGLYLDLRRTFSKLWIFFGQNVVCILRWRLEAGQFSYQKNGSAKSHYPERTSRAENQGQVQPAVQDKGTLCKRTRPPDPFISPPRRISRDCHPSCSLTQPQPCLATGSCYRPCSRDRPQNTQPRSPLAPCPPSDSPLRSLRAYYRSAAHCDPGTVLGSGR